VSRNVVFFSVKILNFSKFLDVGGINFVLNYDFPEGNEAIKIWLNRKANLMDLGFTITFFSPKNTDHVASLVAMLQDLKQVNQRSYNMKVSVF
jgi:hypothetical protein